MRRSSLPLRTCFQLSKQTRPPLLTLPLQQKGRKGESLARAAVASGSGACYSIVSTVCFLILFDGLPL